MYTLSRDPHAPTGPTPAEPERSPSSRVVLWAGFLALWAGIALWVLRLLLLKVEALETPGLFLILVGWFLRGVAERLEHDRARTLLRRLASWAIMSLLMLPMGLLGGALVMTADAWLSDQPLRAAAIQGAGCGAAAVLIVALVAFLLEILEASMVRAIHSGTRRLPRERAERH